MNVRESALTLEELTTELLASENEEQYSNFLELIREKLKRDYIQKKNWSEEQTFASYKENLLQNKFQQLEATQREKIKQFHRNHSNKKNEISSADIPFNNFMETLATAYLLNVALNTLASPFDNNDGFGIFFIGALVAVTVGAFVSTGYAIKKSYSSLKNSENLVRSSFRLLSTIGAGVGGWFLGTMAGAAIGSVLPVVGTVIGGIVGGILGVMLFSGIGAFGSKHIARGISYLFNRKENNPTNPAKYKINEDVYIEKSIEEKNKLKKQTGEVSSSPFAKIIKQRGPEENWDFWHPNPNHIIYAKGASAAIMHIKQNKNKISSTSAFFSKKTREEKKVMNMWIELIREGRLSASTYTEILETVPESEKKHVKMRSQENQFLIYGQVFTLWEKEGSNKKVANQANDSVIIEEINKEKQNTL